MSIYKIFNNIYENGEFDENFKFPVALSIEEKKSLVLESLNFDHHNTVESIFLYFPALWTDFSKDDWCNIIEESLENIKSTNLDLRLIQSSNLSILRVLSTFLKVNPFTLLEETSLSNEAKNICYSIAIKFSGLFFKDNAFLKIELEDYPNISLSLLEDTTAKLLNEGMKKLEITSIDFEEKIQQLKRQ